jgi:hypothetical protein
MNTLGVPSPHTASESADRMGLSVSRAEFKRPGASYQKGKRQSTQFTFESDQLKPPAEGVAPPLAHSEDTSTSVLGARGVGALSDPSGRS